MAAGQCKNVVAEDYSRPSTRPAGRAAGAARRVQQWHALTPAWCRPPPTVSSASRIANLDSLVNGHYVYLVPARPSAARRRDAGRHGQERGRWICGSD